MAALPIIPFRMDVIVCRISSLVLIACEFISNDRCVVIKSINSVTGSTLDASSMFCCSGADAVLAGVAQGRRLPEESVCGIEVFAHVQQPVRIDELANSIWPDLAKLLIVGLAARKDPFGTDHDGLASVGNGDGRLDQAAMFASPNTRLPLALFAKLPARV